MAKTKANVTKFRPKVRSRHPSHQPLREKELWAGKLRPFRSVIRLGSTTELDDTVSNGGRRIEVNTVEAIENSSNKLRMKELFAKANVVSSNFVKGSSLKKDAPPFQLPIVMKQNFHSRGRGMVRVTTMEEYNQFLVDYKDQLKGYYAEEYFQHGREYRIHVSPWLEKEIFAVKKTMTKEAVAAGRWSHNLEEGQVYFEAEFDTPPIWNDMVAAAIAAVAAVGLDVGAVDVMYSVKQNVFSICEVNSAPSMGDTTLTAYVDAFVEILKRKHANT